MGDDVTAVCVDDDGQEKVRHEYTAWADRPAGLPPGPPARLRWCVNCNHYDADPPRDLARWVPQEER